MRNTIVGLSLSLLLLGCQQPAVPSNGKYAAERDTAFSSASGVDKITADTAKIKDLTNLCMVWGFVKYYHADVNQGKFNMDAALFRVLPKVIAAKSHNEVNNILEEWLDGFGKPKECLPCKDLTTTDSTKMLPDYSYLFEEHNFPESIVKKLEYIRHNRYVDTIHYYSVKAYNNNVDFPHELSYEQHSYPDGGLRLLALFRYWNMVQYFFPYRHLMGEDWKNVLPEFIPIFCGASNAIEYQLACLRLMERIHDSHAYLLKPIPKELDSFKGLYFPPFRAGFIEEKLVVRQCFVPEKASPADADGIKIGDIITRIDGKSIDELIEKYRVYSSSSNHPTLLRDLAYYKGFLLRHHDANMDVEFERNGKTEKRTITCRKIPVDSFVSYFPAPDLTGYKLLDHNIGYVYPEHLQECDLDSMKVKFKDTKGIIFDVRCYPSVFMLYTYGAWLKSSRSPFCFATVPDVNYPGYFEYSNPQMSGDTLGGVHYNGKIVILVNEETQSLGELTAMALRSTKGAKIVGSTTAGADGYISMITFPGNIKTQISGLGVMNLDSTETQRAGVKIDLVIKSTIKAFKEGKDEQLDAAKKMILEN